MVNFLAVAIGGLIGTVLRYSIMLIPMSVGYLPIKTLIINFIGSFVIGCVGQYMAIQPGIPQHWLLFVQVGICGGFTTFSTFSLESYNLIVQNQYGMAAAYMIGSVLVCLLAVFLGMHMVKNI